MAASSGTSEDRRVGGAHQTTAIPVSTCRQKQARLCTKPDTTTTHATQQRHVGLSIAERLSRLARGGPYQGEGAYKCGLQGAVGMHTRYIALL